MKIVNIQLQNIKSFCTAQSCSFNSKLNFIIGSNGSGKSNLLEVAQSCFNDVFFEPAVQFADGNDQGKHFLNVQQRKRNQQSIEKSIFVKNFFCSSCQMGVQIEIKIEDDDIANFNTLKIVLDDLVKFEKEKTNSTILQNAINQFNFDDNYSDLKNKNIKLIFDGPNLRATDEESKTASFINFLRYSRVIFHYINFYNSSREDGNITDYSQCFHYFPPSREVIDISRITDIDLSNSQSRSINQNYLPEINQNSRHNSAGGLFQKLAENHFLQNSENEVFRQLIKEHVGVDFSISKSGTKYQNKFRISFFRSQEHKQIPVIFSSGEKELFNFVASIYLHSVKSGFIFIDEPELHLHPRWQKKLQDLLLNLAEISNNQIISVTHSDQFVREQTVKSLIRVHKENDESHIFVPDKTILENQSNKDLFLLMQSSNNTKAFFADKVVLVEGFADKIIFQNLIEIYQNENRISQVIEVVEVGGKHNFDKFSSFLEAWQINYFIIADLDYLAEIGSDDVKGLFKADSRKIKKKLKEKGSKDAKCLLDISDSLKMKDNLLKKDLSELFSLIDHIKSVNISISDEIYQDNKKNIKNNILKLKKDDIFVLEQGDIEKYFEIKKFTVETAIECVGKMKLKKIISDSELLEIVSCIIER